MNEPKTPLEASKQGLCPSCLGKKVVFKVAQGHEGPCSTCGGSGKLDDISPVEVRNE